MSEIVGRQGDWPNDRKGI